MLVADLGPRHILESVPSATRVIADVTDMRIGGRASERADWHRGR
jgi:hypothetical protein